MLSVLNTELREEVHMRAESNAKNSPCHTERETGEAGETGVGQIKKRSV